MNRNTLLVVWIVGGIGAGCGSSSPPGAATKVQLVLQNNTAKPAMQPRAARGGSHIETITAASALSLSMKLASVYLAEDVDPVTSNNIGQGAMLWSSPHCTSADDCAFFDFARSTADVNAALNSESLSISPGTYRYVRLEFCYHGDQPTQPNVMWQGGGDMASAHGFKMGMCGVTSKVFNPPLVISPGDSVAVDLGYDMTGAVEVGPPDNPTMNSLTADDGHGIGFDDCVLTADASAKECVAIPVFVPSAIVNGGGPGSIAVSQDAGASD